MNILKPIVSVVLLFALLFVFFNAIQKDKTIEKIEEITVNINGKDVLYGTNSGEVIPPYELTDVNTGDKITLEPNGKKRVLFFWASWCPYCKQTAPSLEKIALENEDIEVIGITVPDVETSKDSPKKFIEELGLTYNNYEAQAEMYDHFYLQSFPTVVFVNSDGIISQGVIGGLSEEMLLAQLEKMY